jgi:hypothetical protein
MKLTGFILVRHLFTTAANKYQTNFLSNHCLNRNISSFLSISLTFSQHLKHTTVFSGSVWNSTKAGPPRKTKLPENWGIKKRSQQSQTKNQHLIFMADNAEEILAPLRASVKEQVLIFKIDFLKTYG